MSQDENIETMHPKAKKLAKLDYFCEEEVLSGFKFLHSSYPMWFRLLWIVFMFLIMCMMLYQLITLFIKLNDNPVSMDIKDEYPRNLKMPSVLMCPHRQLRMTKLFDEGCFYLAVLAHMNKTNVSVAFESVKQLQKRSVELESMLRDIKALVESPGCTITELKQKTNPFLLALTNYKQKTTNVTAIIDKIERRKSNDSCVGITFLEADLEIAKLKEIRSFTTKDYGSLLTSSSSSKQEFVIRCSYKDAPNNIDCLPLLSEVQTVFGQCYHLNMSQHVVIRSGIDNAIQMDFDSAKFDLARSGDRGVMIALLNDGDVLYPVDPVELNVGYDVHMPLRFSLESFHSSVCRKEDLKKLKLPYSRSGCMLERFLETVEEECKCKPHGEPSIDTNLAQCDVIEQLTCVSNLVENTKLLWDEGCPVACEQSQYKPTLSYSAVDSSAWGKASADWRKQAKYGVEKFFKLAANSGLADSYPSTLPALEEFKPDFKRKVLKLFKSLSVYFEVIVNPGLYFHGADFSAYPLHYYNINISRMNTLGSCHLRKLQMPYPEFLKANSSLYVGLNSIVTLAESNGTVSYAKQVLEDDIFTILQFVIASINEWMSNENTSGDPLAELLIERGCPVEKCIEEHSCTNETCILMDGKCEKQTRTFAFTARGIVLLRDLSFLMRQYLVQMKEQNREFSTFMEAVNKPFFRDFLGQDFKRYETMTTLQASYGIIQYFYTWKKYHVDQRERTEQIMQYLDYVKQTADPVRNEEVFWRANLTLPKEMDNFRRFFNCALIYEEIWSEAKDHPGISDDWLNDAEAILEKAKEYVGLSEAKEIYYKNNVMSATIYLSELKVEHRIQSATYDFWSMLADIGGTISLYVGGTIISVFEIIFICTEVDRKRIIKKTEVLPQSETIKAKTPTSDVLYQLDQQEEAKICFTI